MTRKMIGCLMVALFWFIGTGNGTLYGEPDKNHPTIIEIQTGNRQLKKNGEVTLSMRTAPFLFRGKTYLSGSALAGVLGWKTAYLKQYRFLELVDQAGNLIQMSANDTFLLSNYERILIDEKDSQLRVLPFSQELFVPVRMFASLLGADSFAWDPVTKVFSMSFPMLSSNGSSEMIFGGNWPCFKGNSMRSGWILDECAPSGLQLEKKWVFLSSGWITTSPIIMDSIVYIGDREGILTALDEKDGRILWIKSFQDRIFSTPVAYEESLFIGTWNHTFYCLNRLNGQTIWEKPIDSLINSSPVVWNQSVLFGCDSGLMYCLDMQDGSEKWTFQAQDEIASSPCLDGDRVYFGCRDMSVYALDLESGKEIWHFFTKGCTYATPSTDGELVFQGSQDHYLYALEGKTGTKRWAYLTESGIYSSPSFTTDFVFVGSQDTHVYGFRKATGDRVWDFQTNGAVSSSPVISGNRLFIGSGDGNLYCLNALSGRLIQAIPLTEPITQTCAISNGHLYAVSGPKLFAFTSTQSP